MKKPHEQEWTHEPTITGWAIRDGDRTVFRGTGDTTHGDVVLAKAAPKMARALLAVRRCQNKGPCHACEAVINDALREAGVLEDS